MTKSKPRDIAKMNFKKNLICELELYMSRINFRSGWHFSKYRETTRPQNNCKKVVQILEKKYKYLKRIAKYEKE